MTTTIILVAAACIPVLAFFAYLVIRVRYKKAGPDEALIVFGRRKLLGKKVRSEKGEVEGFRIIRGGGTFVWPAWEQYEVLSLRMMTLEVDLPQGVGLDLLPGQGQGVDHRRPIGEGVGAPGALAGVGREERHGSVDGRERRPILDPLLHSPPSQMSGHEKRQAGT